MYHLTYTEEKAMDDSKVHSSSQNCCSSAWNLLLVTLLEPGIWRWLLDFVICPLVLKCVLRKYDGRLFTGFMCLG